METRANHVLIGAVTLAGLAGILAFFLWYGRVQIDRSYDYYEILFDQVTGLNRAADVRLNGVNVGQVISIAFDDALTGRVRVRVEVAADAPIRSDTVATLQVQGVTGVSFVALTGGRADALPLQAPEGGGLPVIPSRPSVLESLIEGAPELLLEATELLRELSGFVGPENQARVADILANVETASGGLEAALSDFSSISATVREGVSEISAFTGRLEGIAGQVQTTLATADTTLAAATGAFGEAQGALDAARAAFVSADGLILQRAPALIDSYAEAARSVSDTVAGLGGQSAAVLARLETAAALAEARLREAEAPLAAATPALTAVESAAAEFETLTAGDGALLVEELRTAVDAVMVLVEGEARPILADVRAAAATVNRVVDEVGRDATGLSGRLDGVVASAETTLAEAGATFRAATATLGEMEPAVAAAGRTLAAAEGAFGAADRVMTGEIEPIVADVRSAVGRFDAAMAQVSADLPEISGEVRAAAEAAAAAARRVEALAEEAAPPVAGFARDALSQYARLGQDARALVATLEDFVRRIERDPARFFLGGQPPEYRP